MVALSWTSLEIYFLYEADGIGQVPQAHGLLCTFIMRGRASLLAAEDLAGWQPWQSCAAHRLRALQTTKQFLHFAKFLDEGGKRSDPSQAHKAFWKYDQLCQDRE